ncbi:MAG: pyruvate kinase [Oligoflexia bacterium]|nr:pyruvate kinase [Oligoflexia bacterium]
MNVIRSGNRRVKIVCTMGPATKGIDRLLALIDAGMQVARVNFSHGEYQQHQEAISDIRGAAQKSGKPIAIMGDLCGPKIRVGKMKGGEFPLNAGDEVIFDAAYQGEGDQGRIPHSYAPLARDVHIGDKILMDDGLLQVEIVKVISDSEVQCKVLVGGVLKDKKGMNLPGVSLSTPALTEKDKRDLEFAVRMGVDYVALSFVRHPQDVLEAKALSAGIPVIAKIEKPEAIQNLQEILKVSDGVMVARGDLAIEAGPEKVPLLQKRIIEEIKQYAKPVITATQMLDSMIVNPLPTRAEVSDVANAVLDGTDAVMLSAETSVGKYPVEAVKMLDSIIREVEGSEHYLIRSKRSLQVGEHTFSNAIADAAMGLNKIIDLSAIAVYSESGKSAALISAHRPITPLICFSRHQTVLNRLALYWGVNPIGGEWSYGVKGIIEQAERAMLDRGLVKPGDTIAVTFGMIIDNEPFQTDILKLWKVR